MFLILVSTTLQVCPLKRRGWRFEIHWICTQGYEMSQRETFRRMHRTMSYTALFNAAYTVNSSHPSLAPSLADSLCRA